MDVGSRPQLRSDAGQLRHLGREVVAAALLDPLAQGHADEGHDLDPGHSVLGGGLHGLLNAAGVGVRNSIEDCTLADYRRVNDINGLGTFLGCKAAIPAMKKAGGGSIVNISSVLGLRGASYAMAYCASKGAVRLLTKHVALHCAQMKYNIRCNSVHPGYIDTPMIAPRLDQPIGNMSGRQWLEELHPLGRLGRAEEVAGMILFLLSDESSFSTGSEFVCDGGLTA